MSLLHSARHGFRLQCESSHLRMESQVNLRAQLYTCLVGRFLHLGCHDAYRFINDCGLGSLRSTGLKWRLRVILHRKLRQLRGVVSTKFRQQDQTEVDSRGDPASGNTIAIDNHARIGGDGAGGSKAFARRPMGGRLVPIEQARGTQQ
jgi:hypothetical protein